MTTKSDVRLDAATLRHLIDWHLAEADEFEPGGDARASHEASAEYMHELLAEAETAAPSADGVGTEHQERLDAATLRAVFDGVERYVEALSTSLRAAQRGVIAACKDIADALRKNIADAESRPAALSDCARVAHGDRGMSAVILPGDHVRIAEHVTDDMLGLIRILRSDRVAERSLALVVKSVGHASMFSKYRIVCDVLVDAYVTPDGQPHPIDGQSWLLPSSWLSKVPT